MNTFRTLFLSALVLSAAALPRAVRAQDAAPPVGSPEGAAACAVFVSGSADALTFTGTGSTLTDPVMTPGGNAVVLIEVSGPGFFQAVFAEWPGEVYGPLLPPVDGPGELRTVAWFYGEAERLLEVRAGAEVAWRVTVDWGEAAPES